MMDRDPARTNLQGDAATDLRDHPLEDVAAADSLEDLPRDSLGDALQTLLHEGFALQRDGSRRR